MKKYLIAPLYILLILLTCSAGAEERTVEDMDYLELDTFLRGIAVMKGFLPRRAEEFDIEERMNEGDILSVWLHLSFEGKVAIVDDMKDNLEEPTELPSEYYAHEINKFYANLIIDDSLGDDSGNSLFEVFKVIVAMDEGNPRESDQKHQLKV